MALNTHPYVPNNQQNEELWANGIPSYKEDNSRNYRQYVDRIAKRVDTLIKEGTGGGDTPNWSWVKNDGKSYFHYDIDDAEQLTQTLILNVNGSIDWGDGTVESLTDTEPTSHSHTYEALGKYVVAVDGVTELTVRPLIAADAVNLPILYALRKLELNVSGSIPNDSFKKCEELEEVWFGSNVTELKNAAFQDDLDLKFVKFNSDCTLNTSTNYNGCFLRCYSLRTVESDYRLLIGTGLSGGARTGQGHFSGCVNLRSLPENTIWNWIGASGEPALNQNHFLKEVDMTKTDYNTQGHLTGTWFSATCFKDLDGLQVLKLPAFCEKIAANAFPGVAFLHLYMYAETPPTLENTTTALQLIHPDAVIHVPEGSLEDYQAATNWATWADNMVDDIPVGGE